VPLERLAPGADGREGAWRSGSLLYPPLMGDRLLGVVLIGLIVVAAGAVFLDFVMPETTVEPATLLTAALVGVTIYYAIQNRRMAGTMREQLADSRTAEIQRQRAVEILDVHPLLAQIPKLNPARREAKWEIHVG